MKVKLLLYTESPLKVIYTAARACNSSLSPYAIWEKDVDKSKMEKLVMEIYKAGHHSVMEHVNFTFSIEGVSRVCTHQLVRHRLASFSQQSQRHTRPRNYVIPETIKRSKMHSQFVEKLNEIWEFYETLLKEVPKEDARFILPQASFTNLMMTVNLREFIHIANERLCTKAQWEIRELVTAMKNEVVKIEPFFEEFLTPKCASLGYCPEKDSCGWIEQWKNRSKK